MSEIGFDLVGDSMRYIEAGNAYGIERAPYYHYEKPYIFLRDVDIEPIILDRESELLVSYE